MERPSPTEPAPLPGTVAPPAEDDASVSAQPAPVVLDVRSLTTYFYTYDGVVQALEGVSFKLRRGETLGLVGETGCGKSVTAFSITRLVAEPPGRIVRGQVLYRGANLLWGIDREATFKPVKGADRVKVRRHFRRIKAAHDRLASVRGGGIAMIFQEPGQAMNPVFSVADQVGEVVLLHRNAELIDGLLAATPDAPEVEPAIEAVVEAARRRDQPAIETAAVALGKAANLRSIGTEAFYTAKDSGGDTGERLASDLKLRLRRARLSGLQRSYLAHQRRLADSENRLRAVYLEEMRRGEARRGERTRLRSRHRLTRLRGFQFGLPGVRRKASKPLREETFWWVVRALEGVRIANPVQIARGYPHELSGGMLQRVMIAMALIGDPDILLADEPTTALDVTIQAQILELMRDLRHRVGTAILLITHDLAVIAEVADRVSVMYAGQIVETGRVRDVFSHPLHPYSQGLLASIPRFDQPSKQLTSIAGTVPNLIHPPAGCRFHPRCPYAMPKCKESRPPLTEEGEGHTVACFLYNGPPAVE